MLGKILKHFDKHKEQAFILKMVSLAIFILITVDIISEVLFVMSIFAPVYFFLFIWMWSMYHRESVFSILKRNLSFMPTYYTEDGWRDDKIPWVTYLLIIANVIIHWHIYEYSSETSKEFIFNNFIFYPYTPTYWNVPLSSITSMFMHGSYSHLIGNMFFLWAFGTVIEKYIGPGKFFKLYILTGLLADMTFAFVEMNSGSVPHSLGASGAIAGIMGIYAVRCYFKTMVIPIPVLGLLSVIIPLNLKVRVNALLLVMLFFIKDLAKGTGYVQSYSNVAFWAHLGGMFFGFLIAMKMGLNKDAVEDKLTEVGIKSIKKFEGTGEGEASLREVLSTNSENVEALIALAEMKSPRHGTKFLISDEAAEYYERAIKILLSNNPQRAGDVYLEYTGKFMKCLADPNLEFGVGGVLYRSGNLHSAGRVFEMLVESPNTPSVIKEKSLFRAAGIMEEMDLAEAAELYYRKFLEDFPHSELFDKVSSKLAV